MASKRITKRDRYSELRDLVAAGMLEGNISPEDGNDLLEFIRHEIELLDRKHNASGTPTKTQLANAVIKTAIVDVLNATPEGLRARAIADTLDISIQKCSALMRQLVNEGVVRRDEDKKVVTFTTVE
jgi:CRP-like cAMP-binding protein